MQLYRNVCNGSSQTVFYLFYLPIKSSFSFHNVHSCTIVLFETFIRLIIKPQLGRLYHKFNGIKVIHTKKAPQFHDGVAEKHLISINMWNQPNGRECISHTNGLFVISVPFCSLNRIFLSVCTHEFGVNRTLLRYWELSMWRDQPNWHLSLHWRK